jgi:hypothetical protein
MQIEVGPQMVLSSTLFSGWPTLIFISDDMYVHVRDSEGLYSKEHPPRRA